MPLTEFFEPDPPGTRFITQQTQQGVAVKEIEPDRAKTLMRRGIAQGERALAEIHPLLDRRLAEFAAEHPPDPDEA